MIHSKDDFKRYVREDYMANLKTDKFSWLKYFVGLMLGIENYRVVRYLRVLRSYEFILNCKPNNILTKVRLLFYKIILIRLSFKYNIQVHPNTVGYGLYIPHIAGGVILNCKSIGNYCIANTGVVVGKTEKGKPIIGDNVHLTVGSKVIGNVVIGNNVIVAPNSVVVKDVEDDTVVTGIPAKFLKKRNPLN